VQKDRQRSRAVARTLRSQGFDVIAAPSVAMAEVLECAFDVGVVELDLDDGDGLELARSLLAGGRIEDVVFFTAPTTVARVEQARELGIVIDHREGVDALTPVLKELSRTRGPHASAKVPVLDTVPDADWHQRAG
jgi:DNA-binding response OmpR family regulator